MSKQRFSRYLYSAPESCRFNPAEWHSKLMVLESGRYPSKKNGHPGRVPELGGETMKVMTFHGSNNSAISFDWEPISSAIHSRNLHIENQV
jgi:hypothetical protein